jgi:hypothetical protein
MPHTPRSEWNITLACPKIGLDAIACPLDKSNGTQPELGRHEIKTHLHPQPLDASGVLYLLDSFLFKVVSWR